MECNSGTVVTFTYTEPQYRLRIFNDMGTFFAILTREEAWQLRQRIQEVLKAVEKGE